MHERATRASDSPASGKADLLHHRVAATVHAWLKCQCHACISNHCDRLSTVYARKEHAAKRAHQHDDDDTQNAHWYSGDETPVQCLIQWHSDS